MSDEKMRERAAAEIQRGIEAAGVNRYGARTGAQSLMGGESSNFPGGVGIADFVPFLGTTLAMEEGAHDLADASKAAQRGDYIDALGKTAGAAVSIIPGAPGTIKAGKALLKKIKAVELPKLKPITTDSVPKRQSLREWYMAGGGVPLSHKDRPDVWHKKVQRFAAGGEVFNTVPDMSDGGRIIDGPAFAGGGEVHMAGGGVAKVVARDIIDKGVDMAKKLFGGAEGVKEAGRREFERQSAERLAREADAVKRMAAMPPRSKDAVIKMGLYHPIGGGNKISKPTWAMHATTVPDPQFKQPNVAVITPEQLVKEDAALFPLVGDRAAAGRYLTHVGPTSLSAQLD
jgi:hypothetical protein